MTKIKVLKNRNCPICKSHIKVIEKRDTNGLMGPGHRSWVVDTHGECSNVDCRIIVGVDEEEETDVIEKQ